MSRRKDPRVTRESTPVALGPWAIHTGYGWLVRAVHHGLVLEGWVNA